MFTSIKDTLQFILVLSNMKNFCNIPIIIFFLDSLHPILRTIFWMYKPNPILCFVVVTGFYK